MKATSIRHRGRIIVQGLVWIGLPIFFLTVMEISARERFTEPGWYKGAEKTVLSQRIDYIFVGSSRVAAAIDTPSFEKVLSKHLGRPVTALNMGAGYSTMAEHFLGLRNLWSVSPHNLQGTTVFIPMETGLPYSETWETKWEHPDRPEMIEVLLKFSDIRRAWLLSNLPFQEKLNLSHQYLKKASVALSHREEIRYGFLQQGTQTSIDILQLTGIVSENRSRSPKTYNLTTAGGIRNDADGVKQARDLALKVAEQELQNQQPIRNWDKTVLADLVHMVTKNGGRVIFFETPHSSVQDRPMQTDLRKADRKIFEEKAQAWCTIVLKPNFVTRDADLPDLWHLNRSLAPKFTDSLALSFIQQLSEPKTACTSGRMGSS